MTDLVRALTIAGSDSGGGAGIQADLKTFTAFGVYGLSVITAVTAQNTLGVQAVHAVPLDIVEAQIASVMADIGAQASKTGMLASADVVELVAHCARRFAIANLVVDPVMLAKDGSSLLGDDALGAVRMNLFPVAEVVTPNLPEAEVLTGRSIRDIGDMRVAARALRALGPRWVVVKGGHLPDSEDAVDLVYDGEEFTELRVPRVAARGVHGTGCTFSAAIASALALGCPPIQAIGRAKAYVTAAIASATPIGSGHSPPNHLAGVSSIWGAGTAE